MRAGALCICIYIVFIINCLVLLISGLLECVNKCCVSYVRDVSSDVIVAPCVLIGAGVQNNVLKSRDLKV